MSISSRYHHDRARLDLELTMRDALAGLEELARLDSAWANRDCLEILSIEPAHLETATTVHYQTRVSAAILRFPERRRRTG